MKIGNTGINESLVSINKAKEEEKESIKKIASPRPIEAIDGASLAIANELLAQANSMSQGIRNANDALGVLQIADGALSEISNSAIRMNELSVALGNPALNNDQRAMIENESQALTQSMNDSISQATFNGKNVFGGQMSFMLGSGPIDFSLQSPNTSSLQVTNQQSILDFISNVSSKRGDIGAVMNRIESTINSDMNTVVNLRSAESNLQDNDIAENYNELNTAKLKENASLYVASFNAQYLQNKFNSLLG